MYKPNRNNEHYLLWKCRLHTEEVMVSCYFLEFPFENTLTYLVKVLHSWYNIILIFYLRIQRRIFLVSNSNAKQLAILNEPTNNASQLYFYRLYYQIMARPLFLTVK